MDKKSLKRTMNQSILDQIEAEMRGQNLVLGTPAATKWLLAKLDNMLSNRYVNRNAMLRDEDRLEPRNMIGGLYFFAYDPKHKDKLPYYDTFPISIVIDIKKDRFHSLNLHYLYPMHRTVLLDRLTQYTNNTRYDETTRFRLTYDLLKNVSNLGAFKPCYKEYLYSHVRSQFLRIDGHEWHYAVLLPVAKFKKAKDSTVWAESRKYY